MDMSNLAYVPLEPLSSGGPTSSSTPTDLIWGQPANPFGSVLGLSVMGNENGISISASWREGSVVTRNEVEKVEQLFKKILIKLAFDELSVVDNLLD